VSATIEQIARVCHEANRAWARANGDDSHLPWDEAPQWQRDSALEGVQKALEGATPEQLHGSWMESKIADGWKHGDVKDSEAKTHPCLLPYEDLPEAEKTKDHLFSAVVMALG
jgi:hypothetical protein